MAHEFDAPPALEMLLTRLDEMAVVVGPEAAPRLGAVREGLQKALGFRARGDAANAAAAIRAAMEELSRIADHLDPMEGTLMRAAVQQFTTALLRGEHGEMERTADLMREKSGATKVKKE